MSRGAVQVISEQGSSFGKGYFSNGNSDPGFWRKREKWKKTTRLRCPVTSKFVHISNCAAGRNGGTILRKNKVSTLSKFATTVTSSIAEAAVSDSRKVTGTEANEACPAPWAETEGLVDHLPLKVSAGLILESLGALYEGPHEDKYWSQNRCGLRHPYPVGYTATKIYKGVQFKQSIEKGSDGPIFVVAEVNKASCSADSPAKAWSLALASSALDSAIRVHGRKHFGFDSPVVLSFMSQLGKEGRVNKGVVINPIFSVHNEEPRISGTDESKQKLHLNYNGAPDDLDHKAPNISNNGPQSDMGERMSSAMTQDRAGSPGPYERSIRLRSIRVEDSLHQRVQVLSCQDTTHPVTRGFYEEAMSNLSNEKSTINETLSKDEFPIGGLRVRTSSTSYPCDTVLKKGVSATDTSLDSILRRMDEVARSDEQQGSTSNGSSSWKYEDPEKMMNGRTGEQEVLKQNSSMSRFFSSHVHRSKILSENSGPKDTRRPAQTRSLANLLEEWNKGGRQQSLLNDKPQLKGELNSQLLRRPTKVERMPFTREEKHEPVSATRVQTSVLDSRDKDTERKVEEWSSGKERQSSVLQEIRQLVVNGCTDQALQLMRKLQSKGARFDDATYAALFPFSFDSWQTQAVMHAQEKSVHVSAPGGAGKFSIAARCLYQNFVQGERCLIVTPFEALAKDRCQELQTLFGSKNVGCVLTKEEDQCSHFPITVITLETLIRELREGRFSKGSSVGGLKLAVMDRFHTFGDAEFGSLWEEAIMLLDDKVKLIFLSLPTQTSKDIVEWISSIHRACESVVCESKPVQKSLYYCDASGLHLLGNEDEKLPSSNSQASLTVAGNSETDFQENLRVLVRSLQTEALLPLAISFSSIEECISSKSVVSEEITGLVSTEEVACIEERVKHLFSGTPDVELFVPKDDVKLLSRGLTVLHNGQPPLWTEFVQGLIRDNLVKIVSATNTFLCSSGTSFRTVALCLTSGKGESGRSSISSSHFTQLIGKSGRRGHDSCGNVVLIGANHTWPTESAVMYTTSSGHSHFGPSYSLLLNLLSKHTLPEVRHLVESNYGEYLVNKQFNEELRQLQVQISDVKQRKEDLEAQLFQKLEKLNTAKLQDATIFTHVDVKVATNEAHCTDDVQSGVLCAVLPGPSKLLYVILAADNVFRLLPAGALDYVYTEEKPLDGVYESSAGRTLRAPALPMKDKWKICPGDYLAYTSEGTAESARVVEALLQHGVRFRKTEDELNIREEIASCTGSLSTLTQQQETMMSFRPTITWTKSKKLIEVLEKADAVELASNDTARATIKPLGVLISKLHHVENELWFAMALTSRILKPLTAPELAAICSALLFGSGETYCESSGHQLGSLEKANSAPKRLWAALEKLERLRKRVEEFQGTEPPPVRLDGSVLASVHSLCRESGGQDLVDSLNSSNYQMVLLVQKIVKLLHVIDDAWGRSLHVLSALEGTSGLHNLARRATHVLQKAIAM